MKAHLDRVVRTAHVDRVDYVIDVVHAAHVQCVRLKDSCSRVTRVRAGLLLWCVCLEYVLWCEHTSDVLGTNTLAICQRS